MLDSVSDQEVVEDSFLADVITGLSAAEKRLQCKYFYDERGSRLFEKICEQEAYYPTRTELAIMQEFSSEMATHVGPGSAVLEFGSGAGVKTRLLLEALQTPRTYIPVDISEEILFSSSASLQGEFPNLRVLPVAGDYTKEFPRLDEFYPADNGRRLVYFPGSTIGNFTRVEAEHFLGRVRGLLAPEDGLLIGLDLVKNEDVLELAYDDPAGVTAEFNLNLLFRMNSELGANFVPEQFEHLARYNRELQRVEMYLVSLCNQEVSVGENNFSLVQGEKIHTENSHKFTVTGFGETAELSGFCVREYWTDQNKYFAVIYLEAL